MISNHEFFHWFYYAKKKSHYFNIGVGLFIWLFLGLTLPFGVYNNNATNYGYLLLLLLPFGLVFTLISYFTDFTAQKVFNSKAHEDHQGDLLLWGVKLFLLVHVYFIVRNVLCNWLCFDWYEYLELWFACILMFTLFYLPFSLYARYKFFHEIVGEKKKEVGIIDLIGDGKSPLKIRPDRILYMKSDDNYVDITVINQKNELETIVFRARLKLLMEQLKAYSQLIRVHRSYCINLRFIQDTQIKNALILEHQDAEIEIPVSKKYSPKLQKLIN